MSKHKSTCGDPSCRNCADAPAPTASAREWLIREDVSNPATVGHHSTHPAVGRAIMRLLGEKNENLLDLEIVLEAYASSQAEKLRGLGQEAAASISDVPRRRREIAAIIDAEIEGRLKK